MPAQLTLAQRAILGELLKQNCPKREIACRLGVHRSTVDRELKRNTGPIGYLWGFAGHAWFLVLGGLHLVSQ